MRNIIALAAFAALTALTGASIAGQPIKLAANNTHFVDSASSNIYRRHACAVDHDQATEHFKRSIRALQTKQRASAVGSRAPAALTRRALKQPLTINAYFHVITSKNKASTITQSMADAQASALNAAYNPIGITFNLVNTSFTANDAWSVAEGSAMDDLKRSLRRGTYKDLNLYFHTDLTGGILGTCTLPSKVPPGSHPSLYASDGCNVNAGTMPGGSTAGYNKGGTSIHETGHWLGLLHVFEGYSCEGEGDLIDDTPVQSESTDGCPRKPAKDSCPMSKGVDAVHNYMDYSTDECYEGFTPGQVARVESLWGGDEEGFLRGYLVFGWNGMSSMILVSLVFSMVGFLDSSV